MPPATSETPLRFKGEPKIILLILLVILFSLMAGGAFVGGVGTLVICGLLIVFGRRSELVSWQGRWGQGRITLAAVGGLIALVFCVAVMFLPSLDQEISVGFIRGDSWLMADIARIVSHKVNRAIVIASLVGAILFAPMAIFYRPAWFLRLTATLWQFVVAQVWIMYLVVHEVVKPFFARVRPRDSMEQLMAADIPRWWEGAGACLSNCSMPSGEGAAAFACLAAALTWTRGRWAPALWFVFAYGLLMAYLRLAAGAHFISDNVMAAIIALPLSYVQWRLTTIAVQALDRRRKANG